MHDLVILALIVLVIGALLLAVRWFSRPAGVVGAAERRPFRLRIREPGYSQLVDGSKTVECRIRKGAFAADARCPLKAGDTITIARSRAPDDTTEYPGARHYDTKITHVRDYKSLPELLKEEKIGHVYPKQTAAEAKAAFEAFYKPEDLDMGVVAIGLAPPKQ